MNTIQALGNKQWYNTINKKWIKLPANVSVVQDNIVKLDWMRPDDDKHIICQQNNCVAVKSHGLSETIFKVFPFANIYEERRRSSLPVKRKAENGTLDNYFPVKKHKLDNGTSSQSPVILNSASKSKTPVKLPNVPNRGTPGVIEFRQQDNVIVANMLAQYYTGKGDRFGNTDTSVQREQWFSECLEHLKAYVVDNLHQQRVSVAFPWQIGCGLAGGNWDRYLTMLMEFAQQVPEVRVVLVHFEDNTSSNNNK